MGQQKGKMSESSVPMNLTTLGTSNKRSHPVFVLCGWLSSLSVVSSRFIHVVAYIRTSFLSLSNILLHVCTVGP